MSRWVRMRDDPADDSLEKGIGDFAAVGEVNGYETFCDG